MLGRAAITFLILLVSSMVHAAPTAIVEDVSGRVTGVESLDYLDAGRTIELGSGGGLVLGYLKSCVREEIRGGRVKIGAERSEVTGGKVDRKTEPCAGDQLKLGGDQAGKSGAMVFRRPPGRAAETPQPQQVTHATSPVIRLEAPAAAEIRLERLDRQAAPVVVAAPGGKADLAKLNIRLEAAGIYQVSAGDRRLVFQVDPKAAAGGGPLLRRLLRL